MHWLFSKIFQLMLLLICIGIQSASGADDVRPVYIAVWTGTKTLEWKSLNGNATPVPDRMVHGRMPLGSLWKLFYWLYAEGNHRPDAPYLCQTPVQPHDVYCCNAGQIIHRDQALIRSCAPYFLTMRPHIDPLAWQHWWHQATPHSPWIEDLRHLRPEYTVTVLQLLNTLHDVPQKDEARLALLARFFQPAWQNFLASAGSGYRFKTFTWDDPDHPGAVLGGSAGWLYSGVPFWMAGAGSSVQVMNRSAEQLSTRIPLPQQPTDNRLDSCVDVQFFHHYRIQSVLDLQGHPLLWPGSVPGTVHILFANGQHLNVLSNAILRLDLPQGQPFLSARLSLDNYIARVIDREANPADIQAAYALSIAARTWLVQNAPFAHGCWQVNDDSRQQRVNPSPPSPMAWREARFTEGLTLSGQSVTYQKQGESTNRLSWEQAVQQAHQGVNYLTILQTAFPFTELTPLSGQGNCLRLHSVETWLQQHLPHVTPMLSQQPGYEPVDHLKICTLDYGNPYADQRQQTLWIRRLWSHEDHITLWHEYLHLAFKNHPHGWDEIYLEHWANILAQDN